MKIGSPVRLRSDPSVEGVVVEFGKRKWDDLDYSFIWVRWADGVKKHDPAEVERVR